jgi:hypothetical protein
MIDPRLVDWMTSGDTGSSSKAIMYWLAAGKVEGTWGASTPSDVADFGRCIRLLECIPEWKPRMAEMAGAGGLWPTMSKYWPALTATYLEENGGVFPEKGSSEKCPRTYALLKKAHVEAYASDRPNFTEIRLSDTMSVRFGK